MQRAMQQGADISEALCAAEAEITRLQKSVKSFNTESGSLQVRKSVTQPYYHSQVALEFSCLGAIEHTVSSIWRHVQYEQSWLLQPVSRHN